MGTYPSQYDRDAAGDFNPTVSEEDEALTGPAPIPMSGEGFTITGERFDVSRYLTNLRSRGSGAISRYLEVKWRLLWLRTEQPGATVVTELLRFGDREAVFRATVTLPGGAVGTGHGSESAGDFGDYLEKAETKAIGRALSTLGYGTQFSEEFVSEERPSSGQRNLAEAPVEPRRQAPSQATAPATVPTLPASSETYSAPAPRATIQQRQTEEVKPGLLPATERQQKFIRAIGHEAGLEESELETWCQELYNCDLATINRRDASALIEALQRRRNEVA